MHNQLFGVTITAVLWLLVVWFADRLLHGTGWMVLLWLVTIACAVTWFLDEDWDFGWPNDTPMSCFTALISGATFGGTAQPFTAGWWTPWILLAIVGLVPLGNEIFSLVDFWMISRKLERSRKGTPDPRGSNVTKFPRP